ncbi:MAG TPA: OB-fold domain-containing protein [Mycobacterium sp.]|nr:OB-fold domain-containing protein [Mycobacterium sp.]
MTAAGRPLPVPDSASAPYWAAAAEGVLQLPRCGQCRTFSLPPEAVCAACGTTDPAFEYEPVSGRGVVRSWTVVRQSFLPGFDTDLPFVLVDVELTEQRELRMIGRLLDGPDAELRVGADVCVAFERPTADVAVPAFQLAR